MDYLRYCYTADCQFGTDPNLTARIRWYRCQPGAKHLGYPHGFASANWYNGEPYEGVGERPHKQTDWVDGSFPVVVPGTGTPCGLKSVFERGWPGPVPATLPRYSFGLARCCGDYPDFPWVPPVLQVPTMPMHVVTHQLSTPWNPALTPPAPVTPAWVPFRDTVYPPTEVPPQLELIFGGEEEWVANT